MDYETLHAINKRLIMIRVSGYGQTGPYSHRAGYGSIGEAMGGMRYLIGEPDRPPSRAGLSIGDSLAATYACLGALMALQNRHVTGEGQVVDSAIYEAVLANMESTVPEYTVAGHIRERTGSILPKIAPSNVYPTSDGSVLIGGNQDSVWKRMAKMMERPELADDPRYATHVARGEHQTELDELIADWTKKISSKKLLDMCEDYGVWVEKKMYGKTYFGIQRTTVLIGGDGTILNVSHKVKVPGHVQEVLEFVKELSGNPT